MNTQVIEIDRANALKVFNEAPSDGKVWLKRILGDALGKITDRVQTFEDILSIAGVTLDQLLIPGLTKQEIAGRKVELIAKVYNEGAVLDPMNTSQYKYYPWFEITPGSGVGLACDVFDTWRATSLVGVRFCFKNSELAMDAGKKFIDIYADLLIN